MGRILSGSEPRTFGKQSNYTWVVQQPPLLQCGLFLRSMGCVCVWKWVHVVSTGTVSPSAHAVGPAPWFCIQPKIPSGEALMEYGIPSPPWWFLRAEVMLLIIPSLCLPLLALLRWGSVTGGGSMSIKRGAKRDQFHRERTPAECQSWLSPGCQSGESRPGHCISSDNLSLKPKAVQRSRAGPATFQDKANTCRQQCCEGSGILWTLWEISAGNVFSLSVCYCLFHRPSSLTAVLFARRFFVLKSCFSCHRFMPFQTIHCLQLQHLFFR